MTRCFDPKTKDFLELEEVYPEIYVQKTKKKGEVERRYAVSPSGC